MVHYVSIAAVKLISPGQNDNDRDESTWELYDLTDDRSETDNVIANRPNVADRPRTKWRAWAREANVFPFPEEREVIEHHRLDDIAGDKGIPKR